MRFGYLLGEGAFDGGCDRDVGGAGQHRTGDAFRGRVGSQFVA
jgi:hypothetical protein